MTATARATATATLHAQREHRRAMKETLYMAAYPDLRLFILDTDKDNALGPMDPDSILTLLSAQLRYFRGPLTPTEFDKWARPRIKRETLRYAATIAILKATGPVIGATITRTMPFGIFDNALTRDDLHQEIALRIFHEAAKLAVTGKSDTAKLATRVAALAKKHIEDYYTKRMRRRWKQVKKRIAQGESPYGITETISDLEWESIKAERREQDDHRSIAA